MNTDLQIFNFKGNRTRILIEDSEPWFVAKDVAGALGYPESSLRQVNNLFGHVPQEWKGHKQIMVRSKNGVEQPREALCLSEPGLYFFLGRSDKPAALPYQKFIAGQVMPSIRKYGAYMTPKKAEEVLSNPDLIIQLAQKLKEEQERSSGLEMENAALKAQIKRDRPKILFAESVEASRGGISVGTLAEILRRTGVETGRTRLYAFLRENGFLIRRKGADWNKPTQKSIEEGLFEVMGETVNRAGEIFIKTTSRVTGRGQMYFAALFGNNDVPDDVQLRLFPVVIQHE